MNDQNEFLSLFKFIFIQGIILLLHNYVCRKILSRHTDIIKVQIGGGLLDDDVISKVILQYNIIITLDTKINKNI